MRNGVCLVPAQHQKLSIEECLNLRNNRLIFATVCPLGHSAYARAWTHARTHTLLNVIKLPRRKTPFLPNKLQTSFVQKMFSLILQNPSRHCIRFWETVTLFILSPVSYTWTLVIDPSEYSIISRLGTKLTLFKKMYTIIRGRRGKKLVHTHTKEEKMWNCSVTCSCNWSQGCKGRKLITFILSLHTPRFLFPQPASQLLRVDTC